MTDQTPKAGGFDPEPFVEALRAGRVVACATETQIGLLADGLDPAAVQRVADLKGRADGNPIALLLPNSGGLSQVATAVSPRALALCHRFWPGPLTVLVRARPELSPLLQKDGRVGVRVPGDSPALTLVEAFGGPLTATSANLAGQPPAVTAAEARELFGNDVLVVDADSPGGAPSTVVEVHDDTLTVLREGALSREQLEAVPSGT